MNNRSIIAVIVITITCIIGIVVFSSYSENDKTNQPFAVSNYYRITPVDIPQIIYFAGEKVPVENFDTYESLDREMLINTYWQSQTLLFIKRANRYFPVIEPILKKEGVPDDFKYLAVAESGLANVVSPSNAAGFWQFLKGTAQDYKLEVNSEVDERYNLEKATVAAARFLKESYKKYGSWTMAAASYNVGRKNLLKQIIRQKSDDYYNLVLGEETGRYVYRLIAIKLILENPQKYGFFVDEKERYKPVPYETVFVDTTIASMSDFAQQSGINYKVLKLLNPWLRDNKLTNKNKKTYQIKIVSNKFRKIPEDNKFYPEKQ
jgi:hypothetical protein